MIFTQSFQRNFISAVIPAKAGIQCPGDMQSVWTPAFAGVTIKVT